MNGPTNRTRTFSSDVFPRKTISNFRKTIRRRQFSQVYKTVGLSFAYNSRARWTDTVLTSRKNRVSAFVLTLAVSFSDIYRTNRDSVSGFNARAIRFRCRRGAAGHESAARWRRTYWNSGPNVGGKFTRIRVERDPGGGRERNYYYYYCRAQWGEFSDFYFPRERGRNLKKKKPSFDVPTFTNNN